MLQQMFGLLGVQGQTPDPLTIPSSKGKANVAPYQLLSNWPQIQKIMMLYGNLDIAKIISQRGLPNDLVQKMLEESNTHTLKNGGQDLFNPFNPYDTEEETRRRDLYSSLTSLLQGVGIKHGGTGFPPAYVLMERYKQINAVSNDAGAYH